MTNRCQVFTPEPYVIKMLNAINYKGNSVLKKYVLENSCGDGNILVQVVSRYIKVALKENYSIKQIKDDLETYIFGYEIDDEIRKNCIGRLAGLTDKYGIENVSWNIKSIDYLSDLLNFKFHYIIGNPPYIKYQDLSETDRIFLKNSFDSCKVGKFDYCYAFIEKGLSELRDNGKMIYIIPNSIFKNVYGENIRKIMLPSLKSVYDYKESNVFKNALTSPAIILFDLAKKNVSVKYTDEDNNNKLVIKKRVLEENKKWVFCDSILKNTSNKLGDFFKVSNSVATLKNSVFVINKRDIISQCDEYIYLKGFKIEKSLLKKAASPRSFSYNQDEYIIFPYYYNKDELKKYSDMELKSKFPEAYSYLNFYKKELIDRTSDKAAQWFEYGRSQALRYLNQEKVMMSSIITDSIKTYKLDAETVPYSGFYIIPNGNKGLDLVEKVLNSKIFLDYIILRSINANGKSVRCSVKEIMEFPINVYKN